MMTPDCTSDCEAQFHNCSCLHCLESYRTTSAQFHCHLPSVKEIHRVTSLPSILNNESSSDDKLITVVTVNGSLPQINAIAILWEMRTQFRPGPVDPQECLLCHSNQ